MALNRYTAVTADALIRTGGGTLQRLIFSANGAVTAGVITVYDSLTEANTVIWRGTPQVAMNPVSIEIGAAFHVGLYVGYDGTIANVATTVIWRP